MESIHAALLVITFWRWTRVAYYPRLLHCVTYDVFFQITDYQLLRSLVLSASALGDSPVNELKIGKDKITVWPQGGLILFPIFDLFTG